MREDFSSMNVTIPPVHVVQVGAVYFLAVLGRFDRHALERVADGWKQTHPDEILIVLELDLSDFCGDEHVTLDGVLDSKVREALQRMANEGPATDSADE